MQESTDDCSSSCVTGFARASWKLSVLAIALAVLSRQIPGMLIVFELSALAAMIAGLGCGLVGVFGFRREGAFLPGLTGTVLNGLLCCLFVANFVAAFQRAREQAITAAARSNQAETRPMKSETPVAAKSRTEHWGTWKAKNPRGETMTWVFSANECRMALPNGQWGVAAYEIDYAKKPIWLTIFRPGQNGPQLGLPLIVEFTGAKTMRMVGPRRGTMERPVSFDEAQSEVLIFERQP